MLATVGGESPLPKAFECWGLTYTIENTSYEIEGGRSVAVIKQSKHWINERPWRMPWLVPWPARLAARPEHAARHVGQENQSGIRVPNPDPHWKRLWILLLLQKETALADRHKNRLMVFCNDDHPPFSSPKPENCQLQMPWGKQPGCQRGKGLGHIHVAEDCHRLGTGHFGDGVIYISCLK